MTSIFKHNVRRTNLDDFENFKSSYELEVERNNLFKSQSIELYNMLNVINNTYNVSPVLQEGEQIKQMGLNPIKISNNLVKKNSTYDISFSPIKIFKIKLWGEALRGTETILNIYNKEKTLITSTHFLNRDNLNFDFEKELYLINPTILDEFHLEVKNNGIFLSGFQIHYIE